MGDLRIELLGERREAALSVAVCERNRYLFVELGQRKDPNLCSRMMIFSFLNNQITKKAVIDHYSQEIECKLALECYGYVKTHILWVGLS